MIFKIKKRPNDGDITQIPTGALKELEEISKAVGEGLTHFLVPTQIKASPIENNGRFILKSAPAGDLIGIIGGVLVNAVSDPQITMPIAPEVHLNQLSMNYRTGTNHSCNPNLKLSGFNKLIAKRALAAGEELTVDYGSMFVGKGGVIIENCCCRAPQCRKTIKTNDYLLLEKDQLGAFALWAVSRLEGPDSHAPLSKVREK